MIASSGEFHYMFKGKTQDIDVRTRRAIRKAWKPIGDGLVKSASDEILKLNKTGIVYRSRGKRGRRRRHVSSAEGQSHANFSGFLRRSLDWSTHSWTRLEFGYLKNPPNYSGFVEFGTRKMEPRPSLQHAIVDQEANVERYYSLNMRHEFR